MFRQKFTRLRLLYRSSPRPTRATLTTLTALPNWKIAHAKATFNAAVSTLSNLQTEERKIDIRKGCRKCAVCHSFQIEKQQRQLQFSMPPHLL